MFFSTLIEAKAKELGFDAIGFTTPDLPTAAALGLQEYLQAGHHGDMQWLEEKAAWRTNPQALWPEAKSVIVLGHNYAPETNPLEKIGKKNIGNISCYALNEDYHDIIKKRLKTLARWLVEHYGCEVKVFVDTAAIMEKPLAEKAGLGWQGKHTCLVSREFGNWLFLGSIFTTLPLESLPNQHPLSQMREMSARRTASVAELRADSSTDMTSKLAKGVDLCGSCTKCLDICTTNAFIAPRKIDARKCISYLTIEHKGQIPVEYRKAIGNRIYGCDDCLAICPWNKFAQASKEMAYHPRQELEAPLLSDLVQLDDAAFRALFRKSPVKRIGRDRFVRNVLVAIGNSEDPSLISVVTPLLSDASPLVAEMAAWALEELATG